MDVSVSTQLGCSRRALTGGDLEWVSAAIYSWPATYRWSLRGLTPSPDSVHRLMWEGVAVQYAAVDGAGRPMGLMQLHQVDLQSAFAYLSLMLAPAPIGLEDPTRAVLEDFVAQVFRDFPLRRLYIEILEDEVEQTLGRLTPTADLHARLSDHERRGPDEYVDLLIFGLTRPADG